MKHRVMDPLGLHKPIKEPLRIRPWIGAGVLLLAAYFGGKYLLNSYAPEEEVERPAIEQTIEQETQTLDEKLIEEQVTVKMPEQDTETFDNILNNYQIAIVDKSVRFPIKIDEEVYSKVKDFQQITDPRQRAKAIFDWEVNTIRYGTSKRKGTGYRNSLQTLQDKEGICGEATFLYIAIARASDLKADFARVYIDHTGKEVKHGCAAVNIQGRNLLVDPAYYKFDAKHKKYEIIPDGKVGSSFKEWIKHNETCNLSNI